MAVFNLTDYCGANVQGGQLALDLIRPPWPATANPDWLDFLTWAQHGYQEAADAVWANKRVHGAVAMCQTRVLTWHWNGGMAAECIGYLVTGRIGSANYLVDYKRFPRSYFLHAATPSLSLSVQLNAVQHVYN